MVQATEPSGHDHGIAHNFLGSRRTALDDADEALRRLSLERSSGYFPDAVSFVACFLQGGDEARHDERALEILAAFRQRLKEVEGFSEVRDRIRWAEGLTFVRLGHSRRGRGGCGGRGATTSPTPLTAGSWPSPSTRP